MKEYSYEELKEQISAIKTPEEFNEKESGLKYKVITSYYRHSITKFERNTLLDFLSFKRHEWFLC